MILREATIKYAGYDPDDLKPKSNKRVCCSCDECGRVRWIHKHNHNCSGLCKKCYEKNRIGEKNPNYKSRKKIISCDNCEKEIERYLSLINKYNFCNNKYKGGWMSKNKININAHNYRIGKRNIICDECGKKIEKYPSMINNYNFCCNKCHNIWMSKNQRDENSPRYGKKHTNEYKQRRSAKMQGISYDEWEDFASEQKYCPLFNERCRESNREKYDRKCFLSGLPESENIDKNGKMRKLSVHHSDMDKGQGCNGVRWKLVPLSMEYHAKVHKESWKSRIIWLLENIWNNENYEW